MPLTITSTTIKYARYPALHSPLELLPPELKFRIASHLCIRDAQSLALTSRALQTAAESVIYRYIDIRLNFNWRPESLALIPNGKSLAWTTSDRHRARYARLTEFIARAFSSLIVKPERVGWVRHVDLELAGEGGLLPGKSLDILDLVQDRLISLTFRPSPTTARLNTVKSDSSLGRLGCLRENSHFSRLVSLQYLQPQSMLLKEAFLDAIELAPNIRHLTISGICVATRPSLIERGTNTVLLHLLSMNFRNLAPAQLLFVVGAVRRTPNLEELSVEFDVSSNDHHWPPLPKGRNKGVYRKILKPLRRLPYLKRLEWIGPWSGRPHLEELCEEGFEGIQTLVESEAIKSESETYIENIYVPPLPNMKVILVPCRSTDWFRHLTAPDWAKAPPPTSSIGSNVVSALQQATSILTVHFSSAYARSLTLDEIMDSSKWCKRRTNGVLVRSYLNSGTGEEFFHLRRMELLTIDPKFYIYENTGSTRECKSEDHRWVDHTAFKGYPVPSDVLKKVYKVFKQGADWTVPGRDMELEESAWEVLRKWSAKLPQPDGSRIVTRSMSSRPGGPDA